MNEKCLPNGSTTPVTDNTPFTLKSDCPTTATSTIVTDKSKKSTEPSLTNQNSILTSNGISGDDEKQIISNCESELIQ
ncbi:unnamed protein product [Heterobilharzia americana]|nr:unnamed protein product [Heterobilharzia americana]